MDKKIIIGAVILVIIAGLFVSLGGNFTASLLNGVPLKVEGITAFNQSGSPITFVSNDSDLANTTFSAQVLVGSQGNDVLTASNLGSTLSGVSYPNQADIDISSVNEYLQYPVINESSSSNNIYTYSLSKVSLFASCPTGTNYSINSGLFGSDKYCITKNLMGIKGRLGTPNYYNSVTTNIKITGQKNTTSTSVTVDNTNQKTAILRDSSGTYLGTVENLGAYTSNLVYPSTTTAVIVKPNSSYYWHTSSESTYSGYRTDRALLDSQLQLLVTNGFSPTFTFNFAGFGLPYTCLGTNCENYLNTVISNVNDQANSLLYNSYTIPYSQATTTQSWGGSGDQATYKIQVTNKLFNYPKLNYRLAATALGVTLNVAKPINVSATPSNFDMIVGQSNPTAITLNFTSQGSKGSFSASGNCSNASVVNTTTATVDKDKQGSVQLYLLPNSSNNTSVSCSVCVYNTDKADLKECKTVTGKISLTQICQPKKQYDVRGNNIYLCNSQGSDFDFVKTCTAGIVYTNGVPECKVPALCGNQTIDLGESCDTLNLNNNNCNSLGFGGGILKCTNTCTFDVSNCSGGLTCQSGQIPILQNNQVTSCEECVAKPVDGLIVIAHEIVQKDTPIYFLIFQVGQTSSLECKEVYNTGLIIIFGVIILLIVLAGAWYYFAVVKDGKI